MRISKNRSPVLPMIRLLVTRRMRNLLPTLVIIMAAVCGFASSGSAQTSKTKFQIEILLANRDVLWGFDFLPGNRVILTERQGKILLFDLTSKKVDVLEGTPAVAAYGQGGLLDIRVHPEFKKNQFVYFAYSEPLTDGKATTALGRAKLIDGKLQDVRKIFSAQAASKNGEHFGSRLEFDLQGHLFISVGERGHRHLAQDLKTHNGKILRLREDGSVPNDNPFVNNKNALPEIWTYGNRNPQGLARHPQTGELWEGEFGPRGGDEINLIEPGKNYGWPVITYGREYYGPKIGEGTHKEGMEQPLTYYVPAISPSGMNFYFGDVFPQWRGSLFVGTLSGQHLRRMVFENRKLVAQEVLLGDRNWRIRNVRQGPDGYLYLSTDFGHFVRLVPLQ